MCFTSVPILKWLEWNWKTSCGRLTLKYISLFFPLLQIFKLTQFVRSCAANWPWPLSSKTTTIMRTDSSKCRGLWHLQRPSVPHFPDGFETCFTFIERPWRCGCFCWIFCFDSAPYPMLIHKMHNKFIFFTDFSDFDYAYTDLIGLTEYRGQPFLACNLYLPKTLSIYQKMRPPFVLHLIKGRDYLRTDSKLSKYFDKMYVHLYMACVGTMGFKLGFVYFLRNLLKHFTLIGILKDFGYL